MCKQKEKHIFKQKLWTVTFFINSFVRKQLGQEDVAYFDIKTFWTLSKILSTFIISTLKWASIFGFEKYQNLTAEHGEKIKEA